MKSYRRTVQDTFNKFIRLRDSLEYDFNYFNYFKCISCGLIKSTDRIQAGHYYHFSVSSALTFDEVNVNGQCDGCNLRMSADPDIVKGYEKGLIKKYGAGVMDYLASKKNNRADLSKVTLTLIDHHYKIEIKLLNQGRYDQKLKHFK